MSNYIVLVKQVPDVSQITDNAFDPESGTLIRSRLASVINELDTQALAAASVMKQLQADANSKIVCITMGPPMAEEILRYCLARGADRAILMTDKAFAGADTVATANPLANAIRKVVAEMFDSNEDYYVLAGMQSVDGDTAQVPAQVAEELGIPCIAYVTGVEYKKSRFEFTRIISGGSQVVAAKKTPAVITVAKYEFPLFATFAGTKYANKAKIIQWSASDIRARMTGVSGSKTRVIRVFPPGKSDRKCLQLASVVDFAKILVNSFGTNGGASAGSKSDGGYILPAKRKDRLDRSFEGLEKEKADFAILRNALKRLAINDISQINEELKEKIVESAAGSFHKKALDDMLAGLQSYQAAYKGDVWVIAETDENKIHTATFELLGKARQLADCLEVKTGVVVVGQNLHQYAEELIAAGADTVYLIENNLLADFDPTAHRKVIVDVIAKHKPQIALFAATPLGRMLAPMVSYRLGCGLTADCTGLEIRDNSRKGQFAILMQTRPALGGNVMATICTKDSITQMATARPGVMKRIEPDYSRRGNIVLYDVQISHKDLSLEIIKTERGQSTIELAAAEIIVSGGKGMQNRDSYEQFIGRLCGAIESKLGANVERGATRAAVERGFIERSHQVGQTGTSVGPKIYLALGISGAIQHMIGVSNSNTIMAINSDPHAPIFRNCDYYLVGNIEKIVPEVVESLKE